MTDEKRPEPYVGNNSGDERAGEQKGTGGRSRHRWMMVACCIPMLLVAGALIATGTVGIGGLVFAVACLGMMAVMMFLMGGERH
ncbi:hypothetical protein [Rhodococcus opacus]|uniref:Membrane protein n=1 Tax=Rhodococcus opacus TaxID=37919 RepID=A0A076F0J0_RHOOP|nr:hypothetical protein [Rhodococcus opacus]AII11178.1 membrane protein [Rhodococcus opacus]